MAVVLSPTAFNDYEIVATNLDGPRKSAIYSQLRLFIEPPLG
jgi:hypothetical protein